MDIDSQIFLFKPLKLNDEVYRFLHNEAANNIDKIIDIKKINMDGDDDYDDHMSWIHNQSELEKIAKLLLENTP